MALPKPEIGLVVRYEYMWKRHEERQRTDKARPCCIVLSFHGQADQDGPPGAKMLRVVYIPISHTPPDDAQTGFELSPGAKRAAGLDRQRQWAVLSECNIDTWPNDIRQIEGDPGRFHYGRLPADAFDRLKTKFIALYRARKRGLVRRI